MRAVSYHAPCGVRRACFLCVCIEALLQSQGYYRGARAALKLGEYEEALQLCQKGMGLDSEAPELQQLSMEADRKAKVCRLQTR